MQQKEFKKRILPIKNQLYRFAIRFVQDAATAEDIVQEVFIKAWKNRTTLHQLKNVEAWCMKLTKNLSIDKLRSKHTQVQAFAPQLKLETRDVNPHQQTELKDAVVQVKQLIAKLPEKQRLVIQLRDIEEMSYQEIAQILEISMDQVKVNLFRARKQIREQFLNVQQYGIQDHS